MSDLQDTLDGIIASNGIDAAKSIKDIVIQLINMKVSDKFDNASYEKFNCITETTEEELRDKILAKYFTAEQSKKNLKFIEDRFELLEMAGDIVNIAIKIRDIYYVTDSYVNGDAVEPDVALSLGLSFLSSVIGVIPGCEYVSGILSVGNDVLNVAASLVNQYVAQYEQLEDIIDGTEENGTISDTDAATITTVYNEITALANSGNIEVMNFAYGMLNDYGWFFDLYGVDISKRVDVLTFNSSYQSFMNSYNMINSLMDDIAALDVDGNGEITVEDVQSNNDKVDGSKKSQESKDPLILDLNRNGKFSSTTDEGVYFDFEGDGFAEKTAWMEDGDGLLVFDRNSNGLIDDGTELFGDKTILSDGTVASNGFVALEELDSNGDRIIDENDEHFSDLRVWIDTNRDGISQQDELHTLTELGIKSIDLKSTVLNKTDENGNVISRTSVVNFTDNTASQVGELNFDIVTSDTVVKADIEIPEEILNTYPNLVASGNMLTLHQAMATDKKLYELVTQLKNCENMLEVDSIINAIIYRWTNTEDVVAGSRGSNIDARNLAVIEKFYGANFVGVDGANPNSAAADLLEEV